ncbi:MAG: hypothetical protein H0U95_13225 [Bacteroidetes bacterium]|nr:hypothetical protein [Bacteroidota bacterium]
MVIAYNYTEKLIPHKFVSKLFLFSNVIDRIARSSKKTIGFVFLLGYISFSHAQSDTTGRAADVKDSLQQCEKENAQRDIGDFYRAVIHKKKSEEICVPGKKAGKLHVAVLPAAGYSLITRLAVVVAANGAFYTDNEGKTKLSAINTSIAYTQNEQIILPILSNIWTPGNKLNLVGDWRYYKYPEYTYGLGGHSSATQNADLLHYYNIIIREAVLKEVSHSTYLGFAYNLDYHWGVSEFGPVDGSESDFKKYGFASKSVSSGISAVALFDSRKNTINPSDANYASINFCPNFTFLGSDHDYRSLIVDMRKYITPGNSDNVLAFWSYNWFTFNGNAPYLDLPSTGWDAYANMGRGYIQSRFRGKNLMYLETEYRFNITRHGFLGGVVFANAQSVTDWPSNKFTTIAPAAGLGLRIKVNKHSNTNVCIDYGFGLNGSKGIFINLGEVF